jgi:transcriptional regulator
MYLPSHFEVSDQHERNELLGNIGAADLVTLTDTGLTSSFLPMLFVPGSPDTGGSDGSSLGSLHGHLARANSQWKQADGGEALVIIHTVDGYVSPNGYPSKADNPKVVPTWNYVTVNVHGRLIVHDEPGWTLDLVRRLTDHHETRRSRVRNDNPWSVDDAPAEYIELMLKAIVGVEIAIDRIEAKAKLSQNKPPDDASGVAADLARGSATEQSLAAEMRRAQPKKLALD